MEGLTQDEKLQLIKATGICFAQLEKKIAKMHEDKKEAPSLIIPKSLLAFAKTASYEKFLFGIY